MVNKCDMISVIYNQDFHEMHARLQDPKSLLILHQIINMCIPVK